MRQVSKIVLASTNRHKLEEIQTLFKSHSEIEIVPADSIISNADKLSLVETHKTYMGNALAKARACNHACHYPSLADDSGLEIDGLNGEPGVHSHRYAKNTVGLTQDAANIERVLSELREIPGSSRTARFICHLALVMEGLAIHSVGILEGTISDQKKGNGGFGYDPIFIPNGYQQTLAELGPEIKNKISHRAVAIKNFFSDLARHSIVLAKP